MEGIHSRMQGQEQAAGKRADLVVEKIGHGVVAAADVTITGVGSAVYAANVVRAAGFWAALAARRKAVEYDAVYTNTQENVYPVALDTSGFADKRACDFYRVVAQTIVTSQPDGPGELQPRLVSSIFRRILCAVSVALQRGNAAVARLAARRWGVSAVRVPGFLPVAVAG